VKRKDSHWRSVWSAVSHEMDLTFEQGQSVRSPPLEEKGTAETCDELTPTPIPHLPVLLRDRKGRKLGVKFKPGKNGRRWGGRVSFKIWFYFSLCYSDLIGDKLNFFIPKFNLFCL